MERINEIEHRRKSFGEIHAVNDVSFCVNKGELFSFLGVNGAGKSTTIAMICGQLAKDGGTIKIDGVDTDTGFAEISRKIAGSASVGQSFSKNLLKVLDSPLRECVILYVSGRRVSNAENRYIFKTRASDCESPALL